MKKLLSLLFITGFIHTTSGQSYTLTERYNDSLLVFETYEASYKKLLAVKTEADRIAWQQFNDQCNERVACALVRLRNFNNASYTPFNRYTKENVGEVARYPRPCLMEYQGIAITEQHQSFRYVIIDEQTRFMNDTLTGEKGIPYITKTVYDRGRMYSKQKLNPITLSPYDSMVVVR